MANKPPGKVKDPEITIAKDRDVICLSLLDLVANGRLYIQNSDGTMQKVNVLDYWYDDELMAVCDDGYEFDQDGNITRDWR